MKREKHIQFSEADSHGHDSKRRMQRQQTGLGSGRAAIEERELRITEERVQGMIMNRVMNRLEGNNEDGSKVDFQRSEAQIKLEQEKTQIEVA